MLEAIEYHQMIMIKIERGLEDETSECVPNDYYVDYGGCHAAMVFFCLWGIDWKSKIRHCVFHYVIRCEYSFRGCSKQC